MNVGAASDVVDVIDLSPFCLSLSHL